MSSPLTGLTVVDLSRVLSGPYCTMLLADMGARVIKVEQPGKGDDTRAWGPPFVGGESAYFLSVNRNKESVTLDFKQPVGRDLLLRLIERADVVVENFRPGTLARAGLDAATLRARWPRLIYCSISGFGQTGPRRDEAGYDAVVQAEGGLMAVTGEHGGEPFRVGVAVADMVAGLLASQGITLALLARARTGQGQSVDIGMLDAVVSLLSYQASMFLTAGRAPQRTGNRHPTIAPYDTMPVADGTLVLAVGNDAQFVRLCDALGLPALAADARYATNPARVEHYDTLRPRLAAVFVTRTRAEWIARLTAAGVPCGAVREIPEALADPQLEAREMIAAVEHAAAGPLRLIGQPIKLSGTPAAVRLPPPMLGEHTRAVLRELSLDDGEIDRLARQGVVG